MLLPDHRPYKLVIDLEESKTPPFSSLYNLSEAKLIVLCTYLDEYLAKG